MVKQQNTVENRALKQMYQPTVTTTIRLCRDKLTDNAAATCIIQMRQRSLEYVSFVFYLIILCYSLFFTFL